MTPQFVYRAKPIKVVDGDTIDFEIDLGFTVYTRIRTRLYGVNAWEMREPGGKEARAWLESQVMRTDVPCTIRTFKDAGDKYGRWLAQVYMGEECLNDKLLELGHARPMIY